MSKLQPAKQIAAKNLAALMKDSDVLDTFEKVAAKASVGRGSVERMKKAQVASNLDTLEGVAKAFKLQPWQLIHPELGVIKMIKNEDEAQLLEIYDQATPAGKKTMLELMKSLLKRDQEEHPLLPDSPKSGKMLPAPRQN